MLEHADASKKNADSVEPAAELLWEKRISGDSWDSNATILVEYTNHPPVIREIDGEGNIEERKPSTEEIRLGARINKETNPGAIREANRSLVTNEKDRSAAELLRHTFEIEFPIQFPGMKNSLVRSRRREGGGVEIARFTFKDKETGEPGYKIFLTKAVGGTYRYNDRRGGTVHEFVWKDAESAWERKQDTDLAQTSKEEALEDIEAQNADMRRQIADMKARLDILNAKPVKLSDTAEDEPPAGMDKLASGFVAELQEMFRWFNSEKSKTERLKSELKAVKDRADSGVSASAEKTLGDDLRELFGRESLQIREGILTARAQGFSENVILATIQGGLKKDGIRKSKDVTSILNIAKAILRNQRPTDAAIKNAKDVLHREDVSTLLRDLYATITAWRTEEDEAFVHEILLVPPQGVDVNLASRVLLEILASNGRSEQEISDELQKKLGTSAGVFARNLYLYIHSKGEGTRESELLERAEFFGMTDAEVEAIIARERGQ